MGTVLHRLYKCNRTVLAICYLKHHTFQTCTEQEINTSWREDKVHCVTHKWQFLANYDLRGNRDGLPSRNASASEDIRTAVIKCIRTFARDKLLSLDSISHQVPYTYKITSAFIIP
jgi:hypothetical protein